MTGALLLTTAAGFAGVDPGNATNDLVFARQMRQFLQVAINRAWNNAPWLEAVGYEQRAVAGGVAPLAGAGLNTIGEPLDVWDDDYLNSACAAQLKWTVNGAGLVILPPDQAITAVWVDYYKPCPAPLVAGTPTPMASLTDAAWLAADLVTEFADPMALIAAGNWLRIQGKLDAGNQMLQLGGKLQTELETRAWNRRKALFTLS